MARYEPVPPIAWLTETMIRKGAQDDAFGKAKGWVDVETLEWANGLYVAKVHGDIRGNWRIVVIPLNEEKEIDFSCQPCELRMMEEDGYCKHVCAVLETLLPERHELRARVAREAPTPSLFESRAAELFQENYESLDGHFASCMNSRLPAFPCLTVGCASPDLPELVVPLPMSVYPQSMLTPYMEEFQDDSGACYILLGSDGFQLALPGWDVAMQKLAVIAGRSLGVEGEVKPIPSHLLLHTAGSSFLPPVSVHPSAFATLLLRFPSVFTGGDFHFSVPSDSILQNTDVSDPNRTFNAKTFYNGVQCQAMPLQSGVRLMVIYELHWRGQAPKPSLSKWLARDKPYQELVECYNNETVVLPLKKSGLSNTLDHSAGAIAPL